MRRFSVLGILLVAFALGLSPASAETPKEKTEEKKPAGNPVVLLETSLGAITLELFKDKGCMGCHTVEIDGTTHGDGFAADLSRIGDKDDYDFVVDWILEPDSGVMPDLQLTDEEAQDVATWLTSLKTDRTYPAEPQLANPDLAAEGLSLIRHYGCVGCHRIVGLENERIGTDLSKEGSKPKERLDFGRLEHGFKMAGRYNHKGFFEEKLKTPGIFGIDYTVTVTVRTSASWSNPCRASRYSRMALRILSKASSSVSP